MTSNRVHQLSNGLYVSGAPDKYKDKLPTMTSTAMPYTGGDIKKSGELGKMFDIPVEAPRLKKSGPIQGAAPLTSSFRAASSNSGPLNSHGNPTMRSSASNSGPQGALPMATQTGGGPRQAAYSGPVHRNGVPASARVASSSRGVSQTTNLRNSGPLPSGEAVAAGIVRQNSGPLVPNLPTTGLITSGPITTVPLSSATKKHSDPLDGSIFSSKLAASVNNHAINKLNHNQCHASKVTFPRVILWTVIPLFLIGLVAGGFILGAVQNAVLLIVVICLLCVILVLLAWNTLIGHGAITGFVIKYPDVSLGDAKDGQFVKVTGVVTCGSVPLETSYQRIPRCVFTSSGLYEYRAFKAKAAVPKHRMFTWGLRHSEHYVVDFYISDFLSGERALVKAGYGAVVTPYVEENVVVNITETKREIPARLLRWLSDRNLPYEDHVMRLKEGYIKEGFTVTVMGVVQRSENVLMIVPPSEPVSTGWQWSRCLLPATMEGLLLRCEDTSKADVIPV